jgi:hypothetical protein
LETKTDRLLEAIERQGLKLERFPASVRVRGRGIDVSARRLEDLDLKDLLPEPHRAKRHERQAPQYR